MHGLESITVLICTYNRGPLLAATLASLAQSDAPPCGVEIVVVDNNSTDGTADVVREAAERGPWPVHYVFERAQGKSFALNTGLRASRGDVIALTDDDVIPAHDWLARIADGFASADLVFLFGKVLPRWAVQPPPELLTPKARDIWGPLALVDYGDECVRYDKASFLKNRLPIGANLAVRRSAIEKIDGWRTDLGKVDNSLIAGEDRDLCVRLFRAGLFSGLYDPSLIVHHYVPRERVTRRYFRRWFYWHGRTIARMADSIYPDLDLERVPHVLGVPRFVYREFLRSIGRWLRRAGRSDGLLLLIEEVRMVEYLGFFSEAWRRTQPRPSGAVVGPRTVARPAAE
jgi:glycosyltransferase involved in cell wall biosynthesis